MVNLIPLAPQELRALISARDHFAEVGDSDNFLAIRALLKRGAMSPEAFGDFAQIVSDLRAKDEIEGV